MSTAYAVVGMIVATKAADTSAGSGDCGGNLQWRWGPWAVQLCLQQW